MENNDTRKRRRPNRKRRPDRPKQPFKAPTAPANEGQRYASSSSQAKAIALLFWGVLLAKHEDATDLRAEKERLQRIWQNLSDANDPVVEYCRLGQYGGPATGFCFYLALKDHHFALDRASRVDFAQTPADDQNWLQTACERLLLPATQAQWHLAVAQQVP